MNQNKLVEKFITWLSKQEKFADKSPEEIATWIQKAETDESVKKELATLTEQFKTEVASMKRGGKAKKIDKLVKKCQKGAVRVSEYYSPHYYEESYTDGSDKTLVREVYDTGDTVRYLKGPGRERYPLNDFSEQVDSLIDANMPTEDPNAGKLYYGMSRGRMMRPKYRHIVYRRDTIPGGFVDGLFPQFEAPFVSRVIAPNQDTIYMLNPPFSGPEDVIDQRGLKALFDHYFNSPIVVPDNKGSYEYRQSVRKALFDHHFNSPIVVPDNKGSYEYRQSVRK